MYILNSAERVYIMKKLRNIKELHGKSIHTNDRYPMDRLTRYSLWEMTMTQGRKDLLEANHTANFLEDLDHVNQRWRLDVVIRKEVIRLGRRLGRKIKTII